jgi:hypothetical protein
MICLCWTLNGKWFGNRLLRHTVRFSPISSFRDLGQPRKYQWVSLVSWPVLGIGQLPNLHYQRITWEPSPVFTLFLHLQVAPIFPNRSQWPRGLRRRSAAERLLGSWVRIPAGAWMFVTCTVFVLSGRGLCDWPIPRPEESYRLWCVFECDQVNINTLYTCCEQVGIRGKD